MRKIFFIAIFFCFSEAHSMTFTVTNTNDTGIGSLRQAITDANSSPGNHIITFNIPLNDLNYISSQGVWKITPQSALPFIMRNNLMIDGTTQTSQQGNTNLYGPEILLDGEHLYGSDFAFHIYNSNGVTIKGFIIGRFTAGIHISGSNSENNIIVGNYIGCNYNATDTLSNTYGIEILPGPHNNIIGGNNPADRNIISGNNHVGIRFEGSNSNSIKGNYIGLNRTGDAAIRNYDGISIEAASKYNIVGGYTIAERNYISGNDAYGIVFYSIGTSYNIVAGNYIGTDISGSLPVPNTYGVLFDGGSNYNTLGGRVVGAGNLLSGNSGYGVFLYNPGTQKDTVIGNLIGTNWSGTVALPNANGIVIDGPSYNHIIDSNVISGNSQMGISIHIGGTDSNLIIRNKIGTDISGTQPLPNALDGIRIAEGPRNNIIGGSPDKGNIIAYNGGNGITIMTNGDYYNKISANSIHHNGGLGIDLYPIGVTANDANDSDTGPNMLMNYPVITHAAYNELSGNYEISGYLDTPLPEYSIIEIFESDDDPSGHGEGQHFLTHVTPDASGNFNVIIVSGIWGGNHITATATDSSGNTSEFSASALVSGIEDESFANHLIIYPNPAKNFVTIKFTGEAGPVQISIMTLNGETVYAVQKSISMNDFSTAINIEFLSKGVYIMHAEGRNFRFSKKLVVE